MSPRLLVSEAVHERLRADILEGRLAPGDPVPSERRLSETLAVNRHAVREAIKRLQQAGLVSVSQGGATRVRDWHAHAGLDLLVDLAAHARGPHRRDLLLAFAEMRSSIGVDAARLCAERASPELRSDLLATAGEPASTAFAERSDRYERLWALIVEGADNVAYRLALNSLVAAQHEGHLDMRMYAAEIDDAPAQLALGEAVAGGDSDSAGERALDLLQRTVATVQRGGG